MSELKPGDRKTLNRRTFLHQGIFVLQGTTVEIKEVKSDEIVIEFLDREGFPHIVSGIKAEELV
jgi:hypothetical protein